MGYRDEDRPKRSERPTRSDRSPSGERDGARSQGASGKRFGANSSSKNYSKGDQRPARGERTERSRGSYDPNMPEWANSRRPEVGERKRSPLIPDEITDKDVEIGVRAQLKTLTPENAEKVARHLAMVSLLIDQDPELAHEHALAAADRAGRIAMVRETVGCTAYAIGDFALALRELLTHRRISGSNEQIALIVDSERGLGRPDRALEVGRGVDRNTLSPQARVNLAIALSGARLDRGELDLALAELEIPELNPAKVFDYSPALFFAYADVLEDLGRADDAKRWADLGNRAVKALRGSVSEEDEVIDIFEEIEIPVRREWIEESEWQAQRANRDSESGRGPASGRGTSVGRGGSAGRGDSAGRGGFAGRGDRTDRGDRAGRDERRGRENRADSSSDRGARQRPTGASPRDEQGRSSGPRLNRDEYRPKRDR